MDISSKLQQYRGKTFLRTHSKETCAIITGYAYKTKFKTNIQHRMGHITVISPSLWIS